MSTKGTREIFGMIEAVLYLELGGVDTYCICLSKFTKFHTRRSEFYYM